MDLERRKLRLSHIIAIKMRALTMQIDMNVHCRAMNLERKGRFIEGRYKSAYDGDKDGSGDNANECEFLTNPGLQGSTEACKAIVLAPTRRSKTPATLTVRKLNFSQVMSPGIGWTIGQRKQQKM